MQRASERVSDVEWASLFRRAELVSRRDTQKVLVPYVLFHPSFSPKSMWVED